MQPLVAVKGVTRLAQVVAVKALPEFAVAGTHSANWGVGPVLLVPQTVLTKPGPVPVAGVHESAGVFAEVTTVAQVREKYPLLISGD